MIAVFLLQFLMMVSGSKYAFITWSNKALVSVTSDPKHIPPLHVARATYSNDINSTGFVPIILILSFKLVENYILRSYFAFE